MLKFFGISSVLFFSVLLNNQCSSPSALSTKATTIEIPSSTSIPVSSSSTTDSSKKTTNYITPKDSVSTITISLVGDLMCHKPQVTNASIGNNRYNFNPSFEYVKPYLSAADLTIGNLETTFAGTSEPYSGYPAFNSPDDYCTALKENGFDFLVTANNHSMDTREDGLLRTVTIIKKNELGYTGTFLSQTDHDSLRILSIKGIKLGIINYTYGTNGAYPSSERKYMLNVIDSTAITNDVHRLKKNGADAVLVFYHMGIENNAEPTQAQKDAVRYAWQAGAQLIIGAHPHVVGPTKLLEPTNGHTDSSFVAYSLGNFLSNQYWRYTDAGVILTVTLEKNYTKKTTRFKTANYLPTWVYRGDNPAKKQHIIFPAQLIDTDSTSLPSFIDNGSKQKMREAFNDTKTIITKYNARIELTPLKK